MQLKIITWEQQDRAHQELDPIFPVLPLHALSPWHCIKKERFEIAYNIQDVQISNGQKTHRFAFNLSSIVFTRVTFFLAFGIVTLKVDRSSVRWETHPINHTRK